MPPKRIQRKVAPGSHIPERCIFVGLPTRWENWIIPGKVSRGQYLPLKTSGLAALKFREETDHTCILTHYVDHPITRLEATTWHRKWLVDGCHPADIIPWWHEVYLWNHHKAADYGQRLTDAIMETRRRTLADIAALRGEDLACWAPLCPTHSAGKPMNVRCSDCAPSHSDTLLEIANR